MKKLILSAFSLLVSIGMIAQAGNYPVGSTVSDFTVTDTEGHTHNLYTYTSQGQYVLLDFFFDTCGPCQTWQPTVSELHEMFGCNAGDLVVLSVNNGTDSDAEVIAYEQTYGGSYAHAPAVSADGGAGAVNTDFGVGAFPTFCLVGPDNTMVNQDIWPLTDVNTFINAFPAGSNIAQMPCAPQAVNDIAADITNIFPNPTTGQVTVTVGNQSGDMAIEVYDVLGKMVKTTTLNVSSLEHSLDLSELGNGHYMVKLLSDGQVLDMEQVVLNK